MEKDCRRVAVHFEEITETEDNHFTEYDILCALKTYHTGGEQAYRRRIEYISKKTGIKLTPNKRNGRKQRLHLERARAVQEIDYPDGEWRNKEGRPTAEQIVREWQEHHPDGRKAECIRGTGLSKPTVYKWWEKAAYETDPEEMRQNEPREAVLERTLTPDNRMYKRLRAYAEQFSLFEEEKRRKEKG